MKKASIQRTVKVKIDGLLKAKHVTYCDDNATRRKGLLGRKSLAMDDGVLMTMPRLRGLFGLLTGIHMIGMKFPIAVAWLDRQGRVVHSTLARPGRLLYLTWRPSAYVVELHPDHLPALRRGAQLDWTPKGSH